MQRNLSFESLPIRRYQPSTLATILEELPARLVVHFERCWIRDTHHIAADQPCAASRQDNRDAEATTISNSSSKRDLRERGDDESTSEHSHVQLAKHDLRFLDQETQRKLRERRTTNGQLPTRICEAEEDGDHEQNRLQSSNHRNGILSLAFMCSHVFVTSLSLETHVLFGTRIGC